ncbi:transporter substrate-binding domain-containing protein [Ancylobacter sp. MQZ15Z-1]|uniref:Transporter substrate-binding domain-containing protein n=1 Tax=Ancylobacter mangrovi TaxID=2972472 RepID=A0A9X2PQ39_9HYPH|nr:transporter substrate-binding domain-containing protein [Ancylobacter mangrovi]MCS0497773.1 transporter substrate-binding domain-containing protein [Ancylobacter mangrovi]
MKSMREVLRRFLPAALAVAASVGMSVPAAQAQGVNEYQKILDAKVVRVGAVQAPPWYDQDLASGRWKGLVPDIMEAMFSKLGVKIEYVETQWGTAVAGLQSNRFDLLGAYNATPERAKAIDFTKPMGELKFAILTLKGPADAYSTWDKIDTPSVRLAAIDGAGATRALLPLLPKTNWSIVQSSDNMYLELQSGRADALVTSDVQIGQYLEKRKDGIMVVPTPVRAQPTNIGLRKNEDKTLVDWLDGQLDQMRADGTLDKIWAKYVPTSN